MIEEMNEGVGFHLELTPEEYCYLLYVLKTARDGLEDALRSKCNAFTKDFFDDCRDELRVCKRVIRKVYPECFRQEFPL